MYPFQSKFNNFELFDTKMFVNWYTEKNVFEWSAKNSIRWHSPINVHTKVMKGNQHYLFLESGNWATRDVNLINSSHVISRWLVLNVVIVWCICCLVEFIWSKFVLTVVVLITSILFDKCNLLSMFNTSHLDITCDMGI
jgi:hypothetical protein